MKRLLLATLAVVAVRTLRKRPTVTEPRPPWRGDYDEDTAFLGALLVHETETHLRQVTR